MSDEQKSVKEKMKATMQKGAGGLKKVLLYPLQLLAKIITMLIWNPLTIGALAFLIGARVHETGQLAGHMKKDLKGATVRISGDCMVKGKLRNPALTEDQVKVTYIDGEKMKAVVRKTRETVECKLADIAIDTLPLLAYLGEDIQKVPDLNMPVAEEKTIPEYKKLEKKTLIMSGSCADLDGKAQAPFVDEKIDVTLTEGSKESEDLFVLTGIIKSSQKAVRCLSSAIKYSEYNTVAAKSLEGMETNRLGNSQTKSYVGETLVITGTCFPDERTKINKQKKYAFYKLANSKIQILEHDIAKDGTINRLVGTALDEEFRGDALYCDKQKFPFIYKEYDEDSMKLEQGARAEQVESTPTEVVPAVTN